jgi:hypothetical protein
MLLIPLLGEAATTSWPPSRRMVTVFEPIRPVPPMMTILMAFPPLSTIGDPYMGFPYMGLHASEENISAQRAGMKQTGEETNTEVSREPRRSPCRSGR